MISSSAELHIVRLSVPYGEAPSDLELWIEVCIIESPFASGEKPPPAFGYVLRIAGCQKWCLRARQCHQDRVVPDNFCITNTKILCNTNRVCITPRPKPATLAR